MFTDVHRCSQMFTALKEVKSLFPAADRTAPRGIEFDEDTLPCGFCLAASYNFSATRKININRYFNNVEQMFQHQAS